MPGAIVIPKTMLALRARGPNDLVLDLAAPVPTIRPGYLLIRVTSIALNPSDYKRLAVFKEDRPHTIGCDVAGRVVACGEDCSQDYKPGDRVAGLCYGMKPGDPSSGAFGQYALLKGALSMRVPEHVSDAEAATIPVGVNFGGQALYQTLKLRLPYLPAQTGNDASTGPGPWLLIYGGSTATGMMALQLARRSGCRIVTTCSPRHFQLVKALGAHEAFDYHDAVKCGPAIRAATGDALLYALDCVAADSSLQICADALTSQPDVAMYTASLPIGDRFPRRDVRHGWTSGYTAFGETTHLAGNLGEANAADSEFAAGFWRLAGDLLQQDQIRLGPLVHLREGGLAGVPAGLFELKGGRVAAGKLVYILASDTEADVSV
ncbi:GroES-like protein [Nemania diffusa]|nr:GroES-like protein [Nemania diffusa]